MLPHRQSHHQNWRKLENRTFKPPAWKAEPLEWFSHFLAAKDLSNHTKHSSFREKLIEHLFVGELLKLSWQKYDCNLEVAKPEVDNSGYDLIIEAHTICRHIQLKSSFNSNTLKQNIHIRLSEKPSGCVVWILFDGQNFALRSFLFFGGEPGEPLPSLEESKIARHTKGNQDGLKSERPNIRVLNKSSFKPCDSIEDLYTALFVK